MNSFQNSAKAAALDLPKSLHSVAMPGANRADALVIAIQRDGTIWFDDDKATSQNLPARLRERLNRGAERKVYLRVDRRAFYGDVLKVFESVRSVPVENVAFIMDSHSSSTPVR